MRPVLLAASRKPVCYVEQLMAPVRAVIFDLDGTLIDSLADVADSLNHVLSERGLPQHTRERYKELIGEGVEKLVRRALPEGDEQRVAEVLAAYRRRYAEHLADRTTLYEGVPEMLDELCARRVPLAILSNKRDDFTKSCVKALLSRWEFKQVRGEREGIARKPDPAAALEIASTLGVSAGSCAFVGDTCIDMLTASSAGMFAVGVLWGFRGREELLAHGAQALVSSPGELLSLL